MQFSKIYKFFLIFYVLFILSTQAFAAKNEIIFDNKSDEVALVKLIGPTSREIDVPVGMTNKVYVSPGAYYIKVRYGNSGNYRYSKGDKFDIAETATSISQTTITLHKVVGGNYNTHHIEEKDFNTDDKSKAGGEIYYYKPKTHINAISRDLEITETKAGLLNIKKATDDAKFAMIGNADMTNMIVVPDSLGSTGIRIVVLEEVGYTTLAGLKFQENCTVNIWENGTIQTDKEGIEASDDAGEKYISRKITIGDKSSIVIVRQSKAMSVSLNQIIMHPGEKNKIVMADNESFKFEFQLPEPGSCNLKLSSESPGVVTLNMGMMNALIKDGQPMVIKVTRDTENPLPTLEFVNATGKKSVAIDVELSEMLPLVNNVRYLDKQNRLIDRLDGTIFDSQTKLEWIKNGISLSKIFEILKTGEGVDIAKEVSKYVNELSFAGHSDWRIPTEKELEFLLEGDHFPLDGSMDWFLHSLTEKEGLLASTALRNSSNTSTENKGLWLVRGPLS